jgi:mycothiol system anti-sigma-R factor
VDLSGIDCERALKEIELYLDGELDPAEVGVLHAHLASCPPCGDRADFRRRLKALVATKCGERAPSSLRVRVERIVVEAESPPTF